MLLKANAVSSYHFHILQVKKAVSGLSIIPQNFNWLLGHNDRQLSLLSSIYTEFYWKKYVFAVKP